MKFLSISCLKLIKCKLDQKVINSLVLHLIVLYVNKN